jgi:hypothetical protein
MMNKNHAAEGSIDKSQIEKPIPEIGIQGTKGVRNDTKVLQARALLGIAIDEFHPQVQKGVGTVTYNLRSRPARPAFLRQLSDFAQRQS